MSEVRVHVRGLGFYGTYQAEVGSRLRSRNFLKVRAGVEAETNSFASATLPICIFNFQVLPVQTLYRQHLQMSCNLTERCSIMNALDYLYKRFYKAIFIGNTEKLPFWTGRFWYLRGGSITEGGKKACSRSMTDDLSGSNGLQHVPRSAVVPPDSWPTRKRDLPAYKNKVRNPMAEICYRCIGTCHEIP